MLKNYSNNFIHIRNDEIITQNFFNLAIKMENSRFLFGITERIFFTAMKKK